MEEADIKSSHSAAELCKLLIIHLLMVSNFKQDKLLEIQHNFSLSTQLRQSKMLSVLKLLMAKILMFVKEAPTKGLKLFSMTIIMAKTKLGLSLHADYLCRIISSIIFI
jgi:hypothetical protein